MQGRHSHQKKKKSRKCGTTKKRGPFHFFVPSTKVSQNNQEGNKVTHYSNFCGPHLRGWGAPGAIVRTEGQLCGLCLGAALVRNPGLNMIQNKIDFTCRPLHINITNLAFQFNILQYLLLTHNVSTWGIILPCIIPLCPIIPNRTSSY